MSFLKKLVQNPLVNPAILTRNIVKPTATPQAKAAIANANQQTLKAQAEADAAKAEADAAKAETTSNKTLYWVFGVIIIVVIIVTIVFIKMRKK